MLCCAMYVGYEGKTLGEGRERVVQLHCMRVLVVLDWGRVYMYMARLFF